MSHNKNCKNCEKYFIDISRNKQLKFCSKECKTDYAKKERKANKKIVEKKLFTL